jgi:lysophospholipase L1-like esterase
MPNILQDPSLVSELLFVTVFLGANDSAYPETGQHVPIDEYKRNLIEIVLQIRSFCPAVRVILITPPTVNYTVRLNRDDETVYQYAKSVIQVADELNTDICDLWHVDDESLKIKHEDLHDGLHLGEEGNRKLFGLLQSLIRSKYPEIAPDDKEDGTPNYKLHMPHFSELLHKNASESKQILEDWQW